MRGLAAIGWRPEASSWVRACRVAWVSRRKRPARGMDSWVFCNRCFQPPRATAHFSLTSCGHVYCDGCLSKGGGRGRRVAGGGRGAAGSHGRRGWDP